jgi:HAMP domain-containing protein
MRVPTMSLTVRLNLVLGILCTLIAAATGYVCRSILQDHARVELLAEASLMLDGAAAIREYTSSEIEPLLDAHFKTEFLPQSIPFYAATQNFLTLHGKYPQFSYKEATLNPTNPRDRAADWEGDLIQRFRSDAQARELSGVRDTPMGPALYLARPVRAEAQCMTCHGSPSAAPATLVARYGANNGFGWHANEIVGAQVVSVPFAGPAAALGKMFDAFMIVIATALVAVWGTVNAILYWQIIRPMRRIARIADSSSLGQECAEEFPQRGASEITALGRSFNRMRRSLTKALHLLGT